MTRPEDKPVTCKKLLTAVSLMAVILLTAWLINFLVRFDLNDYRRQVEERLSTLVSLPVRIGALHYKFHDTSLALQIDGLYLGDSSSSLQLDAARVLIELQWWGLLQRDIRFTRISLIEPHILARPPAATLPGAASDGAPAPAPLKIDLALLHATSIDALEILSGSLRIDLSRSGQPVQALEISALDGEFTDLRLNQPIPLTLRGNLHLPGQATANSWQLQGEAALAVNQGVELMSRLDLDLTVKDLDLKAASQFLVGKGANSALAGVGDLSLRASGSPLTGIDFQASLASPGISLTPGPAYAQPLQFKSLFASGRLQSHGDHPAITDLSLQIDRSRLAGSLAWTPHGQPFAATVTLVNSSLAVVELKQWLAVDRQVWQAARHSLLDQGLVQVERAELRYATEAETPGGTPGGWTLERFKGELQHIAWAFDHAPQAEITALPVELSAGRWQIDGAHGRIGSLRLAVAGTGEYAPAGIVLSALDFTGDLRPEALREEWQMPDHPLEAIGQVGIKGRLQGPIERLSLDLQADLAQLNLVHPGGLQLKAQAGDKLDLHGILSPQQVTLDHAVFRWSIAKGRFSASRLHGDADSFTFDGLLSIDDLAGLADFLPVLEPFRLHGQAELSISQRGWPVDSRAEMILTLRDVGLHATRHIADLNQINGRARLTPSGLVADNLHLQLGQSPLTVAARLEDFSRPRLLLDVRAPSIRAEELVFPSRKVLLRDIGGRLEIDRDGLLFAPVEVRLDGGTTASVRGAISFHPPFAVHLEITSDYARIDEVIALWGDRRETAGDSGAGSTVEKKPKTATDIRINARVKRGDLYGMSFHDASGVIVPSRQSLAIAPLEFAVGAGLGSARITVDFPPGAPRLLSISGHAEDVDALEVYRELLNQKNIVRGRLRGDFTLSGEIGANYLPSSNGSFNIEIHDGVLHQFPVLSKVFSLLNVSQIFAMQLPDMDREGMPFSALTASFALNHGVLSSDDLKIESAAMNQSYVGQFDLVSRELDFAMAIHPLGTIDKLVSRIPVAGWLLTGRDKALLTAHFAVKGRTEDVSVTAMPLDTLTEPTIGLLRRTLRLPFKLLEDPQILWGGESSAE